MYSLITRSYNMCSLKESLISNKRRSLESLKYYTWELIYHPGKTNVVPNALNMFSMCTATHLEEEKELEKYLHRLALLEVWLMDSTEGVVAVMNGAQSSLLSEVKGKQDQNPILL